MKRIQVENKFISDEDPCFIIAEIGSNHCNDINLAYKLIDVAVEAKVDAVKFQSYKAETLYSIFTPKKKLGHSNEEIDIFKMIKEIEMPYAWHADLKIYCDKKNIIFLSSPFDFEAVDSLEKVGSSIYKIASSEIGDKKLLQYIGSKNKPIIMSTGKANLEEVYQALKWIYETGNTNVIVLHCTASYPANYSSMNLNCIKTLKNDLDCIIGLSDHNTENITAVAAIAMGAKVIEKHITLDKNLKGPDHHFALEPKQLKELVSWVRKTEESLGSGIKELDDSELSGRKFGNRSIHAKRNLKSGEILKEEDFVIKRPAFGVEPKDLEKLIGKILKKDITADMWITWEDI